MDRGVTTESGRVGRGQLRPGDHIYVWRTVKINGEKEYRKYSHHGIYESDENVMELTSSPDASCPRCRDAKRGGHVVDVCLNCFLGGNELCLFAYGVPKWFYDESYKHFRQLTCSMKAEDPPETVLGRAKYLLAESKEKKKNGNKRNYNHLIYYNLLTNNCFHFAFYCKTGEEYYGPVDLGVDVGTFYISRDILRAGMNNLDGPKGSPEAGRVVVPPSPRRSRSPESARRDERPRHRWLPEPGRVELPRTNFGLPSLLDPTAPPRLLDPTAPPLLFGQRQTIFGSAVVGSTVGALFRMAPFFL